MFVNSQDWRVGFGGLLAPRALVAYTVALVLIAVYFRTVYVRFRTNKVSSRASI